MSASSISDLSGCCSVKSEASSIRANTFAYSSGQSHRESSAAGKVCIDAVLDVTIHVDLSLLEMSTWGSLATSVHDCSNLF